MSAIDDAHRQPAFCAGISTGPSPMRPAKKLRHRRLHGRAPDDRAALGLKNRRPHIILNAAAS